MTSGLPEKELPPAPAPVRNRAKVLLAFTGIAVLAVSIVMAYRAGNSTDTRTSAPARLAVADSGNLEVTGLPTTLLIDRQGREIGRKIGAAEWDSPQIIDLLRGYLAAPKSSQPGEQ
ncbi:MAG: TlpA family protein disulfide reductase [Polaromonas sp.]